MSDQPSITNAVELLKDLPEEGLKKGDLGALVEVLHDGMFEVEFCDKEGRTINSLAIHHRDLKKHKL